MYFQLYLSKIQVQYTATAAVSVNVISYIWWIQSEQHNVYKMIPYILHTPKHQHSKPNQHEHRS